MRKLVIAIILVCGVVAVAVVYLNRQKPLPPIPTSEIEPSQNSTIAQEALPIENREPESRQVISQKTSEPVPAAVAPPTPEETKIESATNLTQLDLAMETLISPAATFEQKQAVWKQLRDAGQLDQAIEALKKSAANNPNSAEYPAMLGQAEFQKAGVVSRNGGSASEMAILGMQADQSFDHALKIDPANWDAQFFKAVSLSYWPAELKKGDEVVQRLSNLIDQQDAMTSKPEFAQTYSVLGDQYKKMGKPDYAEQTWRLGLAKFPGATQLQTKISGLRER